MTRYLQPHQPLVYFGFVSELFDESLIQFLSPEEKAKANRFHRVQDRSLSITSRAMLRKVLANHLGKSPLEVQLEIGSHGKPSVVNDLHLHFNVAHSKDVVVFAFNLGGEIGVDVEHLQREIDVSKVGRLLFSPNEFLQFEQSPLHHRRELLINCWTRKEAMSKATGLGLSLPLDQVEVTFGIGEEAKVVTKHWNIPSSLEWSMESFDLPQLYRGAIAVPRRSKPIELFKLKKEDDFE